MPHTPDEKKRAISRLRRIRGQAEALERAVEAGTDCGALLQQIAALRGATNGLMAEVFEGHLRETFGAAGGPGPQDRDRGDDLDELIRMLRTYLK
ncbi:metal/formaldehyde-sensitive transcriptional repressor [Bosea sp. TWI1241]|jgi:DNA-binding FrmR family transcriptional regulator|uniref:metal/formaldehyde-sensitive transcriptional repressor n=1 Tax=Bosea sp. TWI1241 TaxID=3148904 RepID=UPI00320AF45C